FAAALGMTFGTILFGAMYRMLATVERRQKPANHPAEEIAIAEDLPSTTIENPLPSPDLPATARDMPSIGQATSVDMVSERSRIAALIIIYGIVIVFWMVFHQNGSTMTYWADENTSWKVSGTISNAINPFWIVVLSLPLVKFWGWLNKKGLEPST